MWDTSQAEAAGGVLDDVKNALKEKEQRLVARQDGTSTQTLLFTGSFENNYSTRPTSSNKSCRAMFRD